MGERWHVSVHLSSDCVSTVIERPICCTVQTSTSPTTENKQTKTTTPKTHTTPMCETPSKACWPASNGSTNTDTDAMPSVSTPCSISAPARLRWRYCSASLKPAGARATLHDKPVLDGTACGGVLLAMALRMSSVITTACAMAGVTAVTRLMSVNITCSTALPFSSTRSDCSSRPLPSSIQMR